MIAKWQKKAGGKCIVVNIVMILWQFMHTCTLKSLQLSDLKTRIFVEKYKTEHTIPYTIQMLIESQA